MVANDDRSRRKIATPIARTTPEPAAPVDPGLEPLSRPAGAPTVGAMLESIVGCKWSIAVLSAIRAGTARPGQLERAIPGISAKVLSERLDKLLRFGLISRTPYPEIPPRVEYALTPLGHRFASLLDEVERLERELEGAPAPAPRTMP